MAMKILDDLILPLNFEAGVRDIRQGIFHTGRSYGRPWSRQFRRL